MLSAYRPQNGGLECTSLAAGQSPPAVNIDQNKIIKSTSVGAMVFVPPTLIAMIVNFKYLPQLASPWGYPLSLVLVIASVIVPYLWFRRRGWL